MLLTHTGYEKISSRICLPSIMFMLVFVMMCSACSSDRSSESPTPRKIVMINLGG